MRHAGLLPNRTVKEPGNVEVAMENLTMIMSKLYAPRCSLIQMKVEVGNKVTGITISTSGIDRYIDGHAYAGKVDRAIHGT